MIFEGLDNSLNYDFFGGLASSGNFSNFYADYVLATGSTSGSNTFYSDNGDTTDTANFGYGSINGISPDSGTIAIAIRHRDGSGFVGFSSGTLTATAVPEPSSLALLALGAVGIIMARRRRSYG